MYNRRNAAQRGTVNINGDNNTVHLPPQEPRKGIVPWPYLIAIAVVLALAFGHPSGSSTTLLQEVLRSVAPMSPH